MKKFYTLLFLLLVWAGSSWSQSVIIGAGVTTTNGSVIDPVECYYNYEHYQIIYTAAELTTAGMPANVAITGLGFSISETPGTVSLANYTIKMGLTLQTTGQPYISTLTTVKGPFTYTPVLQSAGNFDMIPFTTNFVWDGVSNIVVNTCTGSNAFTSPYGGLYYTAAASGMITYVRTDGSDNCPTTTLTSSVERPNIKFTYITLPPCATPLAQPTSPVLTPTTTTINVSFTASASANYYFAVRSLSSILSATPVNGTTYVPGAAFGGGIVDYVGSGTSFTSTGLTPGTLYYYYIFAANNNCTGTPPMYLTTPPLTANISTVAVFPLTGIKTIPGDYATIALAIAAINANGVGAGGVTFNAAAGYTETFLTPLAGYIAPTVFLPTALNPVIFQKNGSGANPLVTAPIGTGTFDAIIAFSGVSYVTFNGIDVQESAANITSNAQMEYGYAILKASGTQGSQNITIKNCNITLNKANTNITWGVYSNNGTTVAPTTILTVTAASGTNSNNKIFSNTISNCYGAIYLFGWSDPNFPYLFYDQNNEIGKDGANTITNIGGGASTIYGMYIYYQNGLKVANNVFSGTLTSSAGVTVYVMYYGAATNANLDIYNNSLTFTYTGTTSTLYGIYNAIGSTGVNNTVNIYNNTVTINFSTATSGSQYSVYQAATPYNLNCYGNNIINNVLGSASTTGTGTWAGLYTFGGNPNPGSFWNIYNNNVNGNSRVQSILSTGTCYGIYNSAAGFTLNIYNNNVNNNSWPSTSTCYCIYMSTSAYNMIVRKNTVSGNSKPNAVTNSGPHSASLYGFYVSNSQINNTTTVDSNNLFNQTNSWGGQVMGIYNSFGSSGTGNIYSNNIYNLTSNDQAIFGIYNVAGLSVNIYKNNLYNFSATVGDSSSFYGICTGSTTPYTVTNVYNNFISDLKAPQALNYLCSGLYAFTGVATGTFRYYYNTVYLNQTPTGGGPATAAVYASTVPIIDMRNNILVNTSGILPGGLSIAYWRSSVAPATYSNLSNSNCLYAGTPGATNLIYFDFTNSDQTLAAYQVRFPQEAASFTENPPFVNVAATPYNLHIQTTVATQCESGGQPITTPAITTDYDGQVRSVTTPDVGADEFAGIPSDQAPPSINFTPLTNGPVAGTRSFTGVSIVDASGVNTTLGTRPRCYYKKLVNANTFNDNTPATDGWKWVEATGTTSPFTFNINYAILQGGSVANADVIQYFVVAQDLAASVHTGLRLGSFTTQPASVNLAAANFPINGTIFQYTIVATSLNGAVTVGTGGTYLNLTGATGLFAAINAGVVTGNITANILSDLAEDGSNALNQWIEDPPNSNFTLTIQPSAAALRTIAGTYAGGLIRLNGADRVTFNGNFSGAGNWLTFNNTAVSGTVAVFQLLSLGTTLGATNNTIRNCNIKGGFNTSACYGIFAGGASIGSTGDDNDNLTISGNVITKAYYGLYIYANTTGFNDNLVITNNTIGTAVATDYIGFYGMYIYGANAPVISGNEIFNIIYSTITGNYIGIEISSYVINALITQNKIHDIQQNSTSGYGAFGIDCGSTTFNISNQITNNLIYNINTLNYAGGTSFSPFGIRLTGGNGTKVYFNTVRMTGTQFPSGTGATLSAALVITSSSVANPDIRDNIFTNNIVGIAGSKSYAIYVPVGTPIGTINYNDYYASGAYGVLGFYGADVLTLPAWQTATQQDANSISVDPVFVSATDLHPTSASVGKVGIYLPSVTTDFTGVPNIRMNPPDLGAYQFSAIPLVVTTTSTVGSPTTATINGTINASNETVTSGFEYGPTALYGTTVPGVPLTVTGSSVIGISASLTGLAPCTVYHFRAKGTTGALTVNGGDQTFSTVFLPIATSQAATAVTGTTATLNGQVNANGILTTVTFDWGLTNTPYSNTNVPATPPTVSGNGNTGVILNLTGLLPGNTYHYRVNGVNACGTTNGFDMTFNTPATAPTVVTTNATNIGTTTATINGTVTANGALTTITFDWGLTNTPYSNTNVPATPPTVNGNTPTGALLNLSGLTVSQTYHYRINGANSAGTINGNDLTFTTGCPVAGPAGPITGPVSVCQGGTGYVYSILPVVNATGYVWLVPVGGTIIGPTNNNTITVNYSGTAVSGFVVVYATSCVNGSPSNLLVTVNPQASPTITGPASTCLNVPGNVYTTQAGMTAYNWSVNGGTITAGGTATSNTATVTWTGVGVKSISVNYNNTFGCPAITATSYNVTVNSLPTPVISGNTTVCQGTLNGYTSQPGQSNYVWTVSAGGTIVGPTNTNAINVTWNLAGPQTVSVNFTNAAGCTAASATVLNVTVNAFPAMTITGQAVLCVNTGYYNYSTQAGFSNYSWSVSSGGSILGGQSTNLIQVVWTNAGAQTVSVSASNANGCYPVPPPVLNVTVNPLPGSAGAISGVSSVCAGATNVVYSVVPISNTIVYVWNLPAGYIIVAGAGTSSITVNFDPTAVSGNITVYGNNLCGNGATSPPFPVTVTALPADPGTINGPTTVCQGATGIIFSVDPIANATTYNWSVPTGATIVGGSNTNAITVDFLPTAISGTVSVYGSNDCGSGVASNLDITLNPVPATPVITNLIGFELHSDAPLGNQWFYSSDNITAAPIPTATNQNYIATQTGWYWDYVTLNLCTSDSSNHIYLLFVGIDNITGPGISIYPVPNDGRFTVSIKGASFDNYTITVMNNLGVKINDVHVNGTKSQVIDLRPVPPGVYTVIIQNSQNKVVKKIMVNK